MYIIGGVNSKSICLPMNYIDVYEFKYSRWTKRQCTGEIPSIRSSMQNTSVSDINIQLFFGGYLVDEFYNDGYILSLDELVWKKVNIVLGEVSKRAYFTIDYDGEYIYIFGGRSKSDIYDDIHRLSYKSTYNTLSCEVLSTIGDLPTKRFGHTSVCIRKSMYIGCNTIDIYSVDGMGRSV